MYKDKEKQKETTRDRVRRYRESKGVTASEGKGVTLDIIDKLTDKAYRVKLAKICHAFGVSHHPDYASDVWLGDTNLSTVCDWLECTR